MKRTWMQRSALVASSVVVLVACGTTSNGNSSGDEPTLTEPSAAASAEPREAKGMEVAFSTNAETMRDFAGTDAVFFGTVVDTKDGVDGSATDPEVHDRQLRRVIEISVDSVITGDIGKSVVIEDMGWTLDKEGNRTPIIVAGFPFVEKGDKILMSAIKVEDDTATHYPIGDDGLYVLKDGRVAAPKHGSDSPILPLLEGKTMDEVRSLVERG